MLDILEQLLAILHRVLFKLRIARQEGARG